MVVTIRLRRWLLLWLVCWAGIGHAATDGTAASGGEVGPVSALEFRLAGDFTLEPLKGASVSWKHYGADDRGWRLGLTPSYDDQQTQEFGPESNESRRYGLTVEWQRLGFMASRSFARPYWGLGILAGASRRAAEYHQEPASDMVMHREQTETVYLAGIVGALGAEFTIADKLVVGAEYSIAATWSRSRRIEIGRDDVNEQSWDRRTTQISYGLSDRGVALTVAILF